MNPSEVLVELERACQALATAGLTWEWDSRFSAALAVVNAPDNHRVLPLVKEQLSQVWDTSTVRTAPRRLVALVGKFGGIHPGQQMYTRGPEDDPLLFALWWPWGGGDTFSLRVACATDDEAAAALEPLAVLRACFGV